MSTKPTSSTCSATASRTSIRSSASSCGRGCRDEIGDHTGQLGAAVFLKEVTAAFDRHVWLSLCARHAAQEGTLAALGDRVVIAERAQHRLGERTEHLPRRQLIGTRGIVDA